MAEASKTTLSIVFRSGEERANGRHVRQIEGVPGPIAQEVARDFMLKRLGDGDAPRELYREDEWLLALDFREVTALIVGL